MTALDKAAIDLIKSMLSQQTTDLKKEFNEQVKNINKKTRKTLSK